MLVFASHVRSNGDSWVDVEIRSEVWRLPLRLEIVDLLVQQQRLDDFRLAFDCVSLADAELASS